MRNDKILKKLYVILIFVMLLALTIPIYAESNTGAIIISTNTHHITVGETVTMTATTTPTGLYVNWISSNTSVATISSSGIVTGLSPGTTNIVAYCYNPETSSTLSTTTTITVHDDPIGLLDNQAYYLLNYGHSDKVVTTGGTSDSNYTRVFATTRDGTEASQWEIDILSNGKVQFISIASNTNKCMTVSGSNIYICNNTGSSTQKFIIERSTNQYYEGYYLVRYGDMYLCCNSSNNVYLTSEINQRTYWSIFSAEKSYADIFSFNYNNYDSTANDNKFISTLDSIGYYAYNNVNNDAYTAYESLTEYDDIFVFRGHGGPGRIAFFNQNGNIEGRIISNPVVGENISSSKYYISTLPNNALANLRVVLYIGCDTGTTLTINGVSYNLVDETFKKGAHYVLGTTQAVVVTDSNSFLEGFLNGVAKGKNVQLCK